MRNYWDCTEWSDKLRVLLGGKTKPKSGTWDDWEEWREEAKKHKLSYYVVDVWLDKLQNFIMWPSDRVNDVRCYCKNRWGDRLHYLPTKLKLGRFYEPDTRIMHGLFETLVDFIECEKAWMHVVFETAEERKKFPGLYQPWWKRWKAFRCPEAGIAHLCWEMALEKESPSQAKAANEQLVLYQWWKNRPSRPEPWEASGLRTVYDALDEKYGQGWGLKEKVKITKPEQLLYDEARDKEQLLEEHYEQEDERMLIRLIKIRKSLWT